MITFHIPTLEHKTNLERILRTSGKIACDYTFGNIIIWQKPSLTEIAIFDDTFLSVSLSTKNYANYSFPAGPGDIKSIINLLIEDCKKRLLKMKISYLTKEETEILEKHFPNQFTFESARENYDYIYSVENLTHLAGSKNHAKRNYITGFKNTYNWRYESITKENIDACYTLNNRWEYTKEEQNESSSGIAAEEIAIQTALNNFFEIGFLGGILFADEKPVAYTIGEEINENYFCTHIEKAFPEIRGSYATINHEFTVNALSKYKFVNREDDTGDEGLRKAKLSYHPTLLLEKYNAYLKN